MKIVVQMLMAFFSKNYLFYFTTHLKAYDYMSRLLAFAGSSRYYVDLRR